MSIFDDHRDSMFDVVTGTIGIPATWIPSGEGDTLTANVLFNDPNTFRKLGEMQYDPTNSWCEWRKPFFPGLKESVDSGTDEQLVIEGDTYYIRTIRTKYDGNNIYAILQKV